MKAFVTKIKPGSISEAIAQKLEKEGYEVEVAPKDWDIVYDRLDLSEYDVVVNTAGITNNKPPHEWTQRELMQMVQVNLGGAMRLTSNYVEDRMEMEADSTIFHIGSLWSRKHATNGSPYCATKAGLAHYVACMGTDLRINYGRKFSIIGIHPANVVGTPMTQKVQANIQENRPEIDIQALYEGCITPEEIAAVVAKLIHSKWFSGENLYLGGGDKR